MIIQNYDIAIAAGDRVVYEGDTYFGYFTRAALARADRHPRCQPASAGRDGNRPRPSPLPFRPRRACQSAPFQMMIASIVLIADGGPADSASSMAARTSSRTEWFFQLTSTRTPSGRARSDLEAFVQLLKVFAVSAGVPPFSTVPPPGPSTSWVYRGQVIPKDRKVTVTAWITALDDASQQLRADGILSVDGRVIYRMTDFSLACHTAPA